MSNLNAPLVSPAGGPLQKLGDYRVVDEIGSGGMATVYLARLDRAGGFQRWAALKTVHPHLLEDESFVQMFMDEARVAARINHPNVGAVYDVGHDQTNHWIAMEYLHGEALKDVMQRADEVGALIPPEIGCRIIADAAEGLHAAHELAGANGEKIGLVHRDITPHNLFVTYDGVTKVLDFGIAKFADQANQTQAGILKGKIAYMSPEQLAGESIDRRSDIFGLGVVLWELTTGRRLFRTESDIETFNRVSACVIPRPSTIVPGYPEDLEAVVLKALAKDKSERYRTAREFSRALQSFFLRRGIFVTGDEVATYLRSVFGQRIAERQTHLRELGERIDRNGALAPGHAPHSATAVSAGAMAPVTGARLKAPSHIGQMPLNAKHTLLGVGAPVETAEPPSTQDYDDDAATLMGASPLSMPSDGPTAYAPTSASAFGAAPGSIGGAPRATTMLGTGPLKPGAIATIQLPARDMPNAAAGVDLAPESISTAVSAGQREPNRNLWLGLAAVAVLVAVGSVTFVGAYLYKKSHQPAVTESKPPVVVPSTPTTPVPAVTPPPVAVMPEPAVPTPMEPVNLNLDTQPEVAPVAPVAPVVVAPPPQQGAIVPEKKQPVVATPRPAVRPGAAIPSPAKASGIGSLTVVCLSGCTEIFDNGTSLGPGPVFGRSVPAGKHVIKLVSSKGTRTRVVSVETNGKASLRE